MSDYLCANWQGLLQMVVYLASRGYYYHKVVTYPEKKRGKWLEIDKKMITTYKCAKSKYQRARMKKRGEARIMFLRYESTAVIIRSDGALPVGLTCADFSDIRERYAQIPVSDRIAFFIYIDRETRKASARLTRESYLRLKTEIEETCREGKIYRIRNIIERLNGLPAWHGIHEQKVNLAELAVKWAKRAGKPVRYSQMTIRTRREVHKVFAE